MPQGLSNRAFARLDGCSETLVRRALKTGRLSSLPDGSLDPKWAGGDWRRRSADTPLSEVSAPGVSALQVSALSGGVRTCGADCPARLALAKIGRMALNALADPN